MAKRNGKDWQVEYEGTDGFFALVEQAPEAVLPAEEKQNLLAAKANTYATKTGLALPWKVGDSWFMGGGPHGDDGRSKPFNSIDFNGGDGTVLAPADGTVYRSCVKNGSALVKLVHANGFSTTYYHMTGLIKSKAGTKIKAGTKLGKIGTQLPCGGFASGPHVHFSLLKGKNKVPVNGMTIGGWTFKEGAQSYQGSASHAGQTVGTGRPMKNFGAGK
ncbi:M23 family metallopeptidase [Pseudonocardiaceae bacterium YIM PH 21723]|nr:M23 family metallopeptidase [Pseudonocardiaceae bacterium YIM PH 21723]